MNGRTRARPHQRLGQDRNRRIRPGPERAGHRDPLDRRHREAAPRRGSPGGRGLLLHRIPGDDGRPGQDPASADPRRPSRAARHRLGSDARARDCRHRPAGRQSLSVRADRGAAGLRPRHRDREHRHRRTGDAARSGEEPRVGHRRRRCGRLRPGAGGAAHGRGGRARHTVPARGQGVRAHRPLRRRHRHLPRRAGRYGRAAGRVFPAP